MLLYCAYTNNALRSYFCTCSLIVYVYFCTCTCTEAKELLMQPQSHAIHYRPSLGPPHYPVASHSQNMSGEPVVRIALPAIAFMNRRYRNTYKLYLCSILTLLLQTVTSVHDDDQGDETKLCAKDLHEVFSQLLKAANEWYNLGLALDIEFDTLKEINSNESTDKARLREMLTHWLLSSPSRTWSDICNGLRSETVQQNNLADKIEDKYKGIYKL